MESTFQVLVILLVFACTGFTVAFLKRPILSLFDSSGNIWFSVVYYLLILPVYNLLLLVYGFVFGQFRFFYEFEKRFFRRIFSKRDKQN